MQAYTPQDLTDESIIEYKIAIDKEFYIRNLQDNELYIYLTKWP